MQLPWTYSLAGASCLYANFNVHQGVTHTAHTVRYSRQEKLVLTFFALSTVVNLALGYGLAIYLMRARQDQHDIGLPEQSPNDIAETSFPTPSVASRVTAVPALAPLAASPQSVIPTPELPELVSPMQSTQTQTNSPEPTSPESRVQSPEPESTSPESRVQSPEPNSLESRVQSPEPESTIIEGTDSDTQPPSEEDLLAGIAAFRAQLSAENPPAESNPGNEVNADTLP